ncbi:MAG: FliH/SctL family protein [Vulcanimicrobiaceae bacterium]
MGKIVRFSRLAQECYQIQVPNLLFEEVRLLPDRFDDDPAFVAQTAELTLRPPAQPPLDAEVVARQARALIDSAEMQAQALIDDARERSLSLLTDAERRVSALEADARERGFAQGEHDGLAVADAQMNEMIVTMRGLVDMARQERHKIVESAEPEIVKLALAVAERVVHRQISVEPEIVVENVRSAITRLLAREAVTVRVSPADLETMRGHRDSLLADHDIERLHIVEDQRVDRGGVVIETDSGTIDAKIATQLREARRALHVDDAISIQPSSEEAVLRPPAQAS